MTLSLILALEFLSQKINTANNIDLPFLFLASGNMGKVSADSTFNVIDPHLGYTHGDGDHLLGDLEKRYSWVDGFVVYKKPGQEIDHPVVLALGGSTTDGVNYGHSWPESLAEMLAKKGFRGTIINGGTGGYSTNQELLKLIRDGLTFHPDIIISYSGVNDRGRYSKLPYPMVHSHQRQLLESLTQKSVSRFMPNAVALLKRAGSKQNSSITYTLGVKSDLSLAEQYERNMNLMDSIAQTYGASFFAFIQPNAAWKSRHFNDRFYDDGAEHKNTIVSLYSEITQIPKRHKYCHDLTNIFESHDAVYKEDGTHATALGDKIIAEEVYKIISETLKNKQEVAHKYLPDSSPGSLSHAAVPGQKNSLRTSSILLK